jgi:hypothetical protein
MSEKTTVAILFLVLSGTLWSCDSTTGIDVDLDAFDAIPNFEQLDLGALQTEGSYDYWEIRTAFEGFAYQVIGTGGTLSKEDLDPEVIEALDTLAVEIGFGLGCLPGYCYTYVVSVRDGSVIEVRSTTDALAAFLAPIDVWEEAAFLAYAHGYYWAAFDKELGAIRRTEDGYDMVALKTVEFCDPVRTDRFLLHIDVSGLLTEVASEVWRSDEGVCI